MAGDKPVAPVFKSTMTDRNLARQWPNTEQITQWMRERVGDTVLLPFSTGKDCVAAWLALRDAGFNVIPFYLQLVPGLEFVERTLNYYEGKFKTHIHRFIHPAIWDELCNGTYQAPHGIVAIQSSEMYEYGLDFVANLFSERAGLPEDETLWGVSGWRITDSFNRMATLRTYGPIDVPARTIHLIWHWTTDEVLRKIAKAGMSLSSDYRIWGKSFTVGLGPELLCGVAKHYPKDFERICQWFPLARAAVFRREMELKHYGYLVRNEDGAEDSETEREDKKAKRLQPRRTVELVY